MGEYIKSRRIDGEEIKIGVCRGDKWETWFAKDMLLLLKEKGFEDWYAGEFCGNANTLDEFIEKYEQIDTSFIKYSSITDIVEEYPEYEGILMKNEIVIEFKNIISELESKKLKLCFLKDRGIFVEDNQKNLYKMETYWHGSYLDKLIKDGTIVKFSLVDSTNIEDWEKEIWGVPEVKAFIKRQSLPDETLLWL